MFLWPNPSPLIPHCGRVNCVPSPLPLPDVHILNPRTCYLTWQKGLCRYEWTEVGRLSWIIQVVPNVVRASLQKGGRGRSDNGREGDAMMEAETEVMCVEDGKGATSQEKQAALEASDRHRSRLSLRASRRSQCWTSGLQCSEAEFRLLISKTVGE